ncbi:MAG: hypothetical protein ACLUD0_06485 [Eubacterium ramulus]
MNPVTYNESTWARWWLRSIPKSGGIVADNSQAVPEKQLWDV